MSGSFLTGHLVGSDQRAAAAFEIMKVSIAMSFNRVRSAMALALVVICGTPATAEFRYDNNSGGYSLVADIGCATENW